MSGSVISSNVTTKVNRAISGATTVNANCYAVVEYYNSGYTQTAGGSSQLSYVPDIYTRHFGPGASIPANFSLQCDPDINNAGPVAEARFVLLTGVEFINSP